MSVSRYFSDIFKVARSICIGMGITLKYFFDYKKRTITVQYPHEHDSIPPRHRGIHYLETEKCVMCWKCSDICPVDCIYIEGTRGADGVLEKGYRGQKATLSKFTVDYTVCIFCGLCEEPCPPKCIFLGPEYDFHATDRTMMEKNLLTDEVYTDEDEEFVRWARGENERLIAEKKRRAAEEKAAKEKEKVAKEKEKPTEEKAAVGKKGTTGASASDEKGAKEKAPGKEAVATQSAKPEANPEKKGAVEKPASKEAAATTSANPDPKGASEKAPQKEAAATTSANPDPKGASEKAPEKEAAAAKSSKSSNPDRKRAPERGSEETKGEKGADEKSPQSADKTVEVEAKGTESRETQSRGKGK